MQHTLLPAQDKVQAFAAASVTAACRIHAATVTQQPAAAWPESVVHRGAQSQQWEELSPEHKWRRGQILPGGAWQPAGRCRPHPPPPRQGLSGQSPQRELPRRAFRPWPCCSQRAAVHGPGVRPCGQPFLVRAKGIDFRCRAAGRRHRRAQQLHGEVRLAQAAPAAVASARPRWASRCSLR